MKSQKRFHGTRCVKIAPWLFDFSLIHGTKALFNWIYFQPVTEYSLGGYSDLGCLTKSL